MKKSVSCIIVAKDKKNNLYVLLTTRKYRRTLASISGFIDKDEMLSAAIKRECSEETGINLENFKILKGSLNKFFDSKKETYNQHDGETETFFFKVLIEVDILPKIHASDETGGVHWYLITSILDLDDLKSKFNWKNDFFNIKRFIENILNEIG